MYKLPEGTYIVRYWGVRGRVHGAPARHEYFYTTKEVTYTKKELGKTSHGCSGWADHEDTYIIQINDPQFTHIKIWKRDLLSNV